MLRLTANKTKLYTLVADYVDNLPPMRKTEFIKYPRTPDYALEWATEREKGRAFLSACMGRPLLKIDIDEKETGRLVRGACKYIDLQDLRERGMVEEFTTAAERRRKSEQRRRAVRRRRITAVACLGAVLLAMVWAIAMACAAAGEEETAMPTPVALAPVSTVTPEAGEDPLEAEKIEAALLEQGYFSDAIPLPYDLQDTMRTACEEYGCPYPLALAVAEVESNFDVEAVGAVGEVGVMQLNPGPENTYWINLQAETNQDPTTPAGNIVCGVYLLGTHLINYEDTEKALMAYNMGPAGALQAWEAGVTSTEYTEKVMEAANRWEAVLG